MAADAESGQSPAAYAAEALQAARRGDPDALDLVMMRFAGEWLAPDVDRQVSYMEVRALRAFALALTES
ncbi:hypothetical protein [Patulibacter medicamentivorans]|uniref:hypothetical protein n=1 Tax=Patulibacter medicamentivorans TaxID=1097667 RepID=UPI00058D584B|nr:hypothetical protein [Patulibacter medicamentivorans]